MEKLCEEQAETGLKLQQILVNFKKDSSSRKTEEYVDKRLTLLETYWATFNDTHKNILPFEETHSDHPYFQKSYYDEVNKLVLTTRSVLLDAKAKATTKPPSSDHQTIASTSTLTTTSTKMTTNNPLPDIGKNDEASAFKLNYEDKVEDPEDELRKIVRRQRALMKTLTHLIQDIEAKADQDHLRPYYDLKISLLNKYQAEMSQTDKLIWENSAEDKPFGYESDLYHELDDWTQDTIITLQQQLLNLNNNSINTNIQSNNNQVKLPKIVLPQFDGDYLKWTQFHDLYNQLIHNQPISNAQKMFYLISNLSGEARALMQHLPVSEENYEAAWSILNNRYNNQRLLVTALLNKFLSQPVIQVESAATIKALHDITNECLRGLKNLGLAIESWDPILVHILIQKFDKNTQALYKQSLVAPRELNSIKRTLEFLETRFQALEALGGKTHGSPREKINQRHGYQSKQSAFVATSNRTCCIACKRIHPLYSCSKFRSQTPKDRFQLVQRRKYTQQPNVILEGAQGAKRNTTRCCILINQRSKMFNQGRMLRRFMVQKDPCATKLQAIPK